MMALLWDDLRFAGRGLRKSPGFTGVAVLTLALGIGASTSIVSVVYGVLLRPFPYRDPASLVIISAERAFGGQVRRANYSALELEDWRGRSRALDSLAMFGGTRFSLKSDAGSQTLGGTYVSDRFFSTLDQPMALGRPIGPAEAREAVAVISHALWTRQFGADPQAIGRTIVLNDRPYVVVGIARGDFQFPSARTDVWTPLGHAQALGSEPWVNNRRGGGFTFVARMRTGVTVNAAREDIDRVSRSLATEFPDMSEGRRPLVFGLVDWFASEVRPALLMFLAATGLVLLVACVNAMNLLLARQMSRSQETVVRRALGASRARLVVGSIAESLWLALIGGAGGVLIATFGVRAFVAVWPGVLPRVDAIHVDWPVLLFTLGLSMITAIVCAMAPALRSLRTDLASGIRPAGFTRSAGSRRLRSTLVIVELAVSVTLLVGAGLLGRSLDRLLRSEIGVTTGHVVVAELDLGAGRRVSANEQIRLVDRVLDGAATIPGLRRVSVATSLPLTGARLRYTLKDVNGGDGRVSDYDVDALATTPDFFPALGVRLVNGRMFTPSDDEGHQPVMIMSERTARRFFGDRDPIGRVLSLPSRGPTGSEDVTLVGIVGDVKYQALDAAADGGIYRPFRQQPWSTGFIVAQTSGEPAAVAVALRRQVAFVDPQIAVDRVRTLDDVVSESAATPVFRTTLLVTLAVLAVTLASIGLYGAVAYSVSLRTTELGIRMALGASPASVVGMVVREGVALGVAGAVAGVAGAYVFVRVIATFLYGVEPTDAVTFIAAPVGLLLLATLASYLPARRAAAIDPSVALRTE